MPDEAAPETTTKPTEKEGEEKNKLNLPKILQEASDAPTQQVIDAWKDKWGDVFVSGFSDKELYIWRTLTRGEWKQTQAKLAEGGPESSEADFQEMVCSMCVLWPKTPEGYFSKSSKAGTATTITEQVMQRSNFMSPAAASYLVAQL